MSQEQCIDGSRVIVQLVKDMVGRRGIALVEANWLPNPAQEAPDESSEFYTLVVVAGQNLAQQRFPRVDLEGAHRSEAARKRIRALVREAGFAEALSFDSGGQTSRG